jgi:hypothetical protein
MFVSIAECCQWPRFRQVESLEVKEQFDGSIGVGGVMSSGRHQWVVAPFQSVGADGGVAEGGHAPWPDCRCGSGECYSSGRHLIPNWKRLFNVPELARLGGDASWGSAHGSGE